MKCKYGYALGICGSVCLGDFLSKTGQSKKKENETFDDGSISI